MTKRRRKKVFTGTPGPTATLPKPNIVPAQGELAGAKTISFIVMTLPAGMLVAPAVKGAVVVNCPITVAKPVVSLIVTRVEGALGLALPVAPNSVPFVVAEGC